MQPVQIEQPGQVVGFIEYSHRTSVPKRRCVIYADKSILIGRGAFCDLAFTGDEAISNKHLQIYCVIYDKSDDEIKPMVYAEDLSSNGSYWNGSYMGKGRGGMLLSNRDELRLSPRVLLTFFTLIEYEIDHLEAHQRIESKFFQNHYEISTRVLGSGAHGKVYMAVNITQGHQVACKVVNLKAIRTREARTLKEMTSNRDQNFDSRNTTRALRRLTKSCVAKDVEEAASKVAREVEILRTLSHPNIMRIEKAFKTEDTIYIFEELVTGGDLISFLDHRGGKLHEAEAGIIIRQLLEAIKYLHLREIAHRDVKPENVLVASLSAGARVVLTDFGSAIQATSCSGTGLSRMNTRVGTLEYSAPEVILYSVESPYGMEGYTKAVDMWSLGCVTMALLTGSSPFQDVFAVEDSNFTGERVRHITSAWDQNGFTKCKEWQLLSERPRDFIRNLLVIDVNHRLTVGQAINHHWLTNDIVKEAFDLAYQKAITSWDTLALTSDVMRPILDFTKPGTNAKPSKKAFSVEVFDHAKHSRKGNSKNGEPIDAHYHPIHRRFAQALFSPRL